MGDYSYCEEQEITIKDYEGLKPLITHEQNWNVISDDGLKVDFEEWDDKKLEGYWYKNTIDFLKKIALCVDGWAEFSCSYGYKFRIVFKDNKALFQKQPDIDWSKAPLSEVGE